MQAPAAAHGGGEGVAEEGCDDHRASAESQITSATPAASTAAASNRHFAFKAAQTKSSLRMNHE
jgi:hypothetical protein